MNSPAISELDMQSDLEDGFIFFDSLRDRHFDFVTEELSLLVAGFQFLQDLLNVDCLEQRKECFIVEVAFVRKSMGCYKNCQKRTCWLR